MADEAISAVKAAISGKDLDVKALDNLAFNAPEASKARNELIPLLLQLSSVHPETASQIPEKTVEVVLEGLNLEEVLRLTGLENRHLENDLVRPLLLSQIALKVTEEDAEGKLKDLITNSLALIARPELDTQSVASIEKIVAKIPAIALKYLPFPILYNGQAELKSRLMAINITFLKRKVAPPSKYLIWQPIANEEDDVLLAVLQVDYIGALVPFFFTEKSIQDNLHDVLFELCKRYQKSSDSLLTHPIESVLSMVCQKIEGLFLELDAQYLIVRVDRPALIAQLPATYVVTHHPEVVEELELNSKNLYAVANVTQDPRGLQLLPLTSSKVLKLPVPSQLVLAAAATNSKEGAEIFRDRFSEALQNAWNMPEAQESVELKATLRVNLHRWGIRVRKQPEVQLG